MVFILFILVISGILSRIDKRLNKFYSNSLNLTAFFLAQPSFRFDSTRISSCKYKLAKFILLFTWLLCSTILNKCFTSLLLKTYFKTKPFLAVETLEDIVSNPKMKIIGKQALLQIKSFKSNIYQNLNERLNKYERELNISNVDLMKVLTNSQVFNDVNEGKTVLLVDSHESHMFRDIYPLIKLKVSKHKYSHQIIYSYISRSHSKYEQIFQM